MKFLLVEDDKLFAETLIQVLARHRYLVDLATDGEMGMGMAEAFAYDGILLDFKLPKANGIEICQYLRTAGNKTPIILMTGQGVSSDKVAALDAGADDYLVKPFEFEELLARIRALLRRTKGLASPVLKWGELCLNPSNAAVSVRDIPVALTPKEYALLELFLRNPGRIFSLDSLLDKAWSFEDSPSVGSVRTHIKGLRQKLKAVKLPEMIETMYGLGYRLKAACNARSPEKNMASRQAGVPAAHVLANKREQDRANLGNPLKSHSMLPKNLATPLVSTPPLITAFSTDSPSPKTIPRLLILEDSENSGWALSVADVATNHGLAVEIVHATQQSPADIFSESNLRPDIILLSLNAAGNSCGNCSPKGVNNGWSLLAQLQSEQVKNTQGQNLPSPVPVLPVPVLVVTPNPSFETRVKVARLGAAGLLTQPAIPTEVVSTVIQILQKGLPPRAKLLVVDNDPQMLTVLSDLLQPWGLRIQRLKEPERFWETLEQFLPDLIILDTEMTPLSGLELCQVLRNSPEWSDLPVLFLSAHTDEETIQKAFWVGADDYVRKPVVAPELVARVLSWLERSRTRQFMADVDNLTGVANRRKSTQDLMRLLGLAQRQKQPLCLGLLDLDNFKQINDDYGHAVGDRVLRRLGEQLRTTFRGEDIVARWGGEEFVVGLYGIDSHEGRQRMDQFSQHWQQESFTVKANTFHSTFSAGIATYPHDATDLRGLYRAADTVLCQRKTARRDRVQSIFPP
ncbi:MAG: response regulator [Cyanobacteria bacterium P01_F01_bin.53]